ncbi:peptide deformylase [Roseobacter sp. YSTF-M11]|uniref:Peptide deformylase n=1 Tax=Roseobacter insulae TaxID=2859783 RepID=A0A9X1FX97_9RHOB|nr:peptide deformylase [Roseobacter insulae]MBW4709256.1 peptide deformylase [Roseobacter insulae]
MTVRQIVRWPDPHLRAVCDPVAVTGPEVAALARDLLDTMYAAPGRGLAAPQIGVLQRVFVTDTTWKDGTASPIIFINPRITGASEETTVQAEGCLSIPGVSVDVRRPSTVTMTWTALDGTEQSRSFSGFAAACVQHELDHLNGVVTLDHLPADQRQKAEEACAGALP